MLAEAERKAGQLARSLDACRAHMDKAREYDWLADAEPQLDEAITTASGSAGERA